jgi:selT/selW/selH-like putative selenoprotein
MRVRIVFCAICGYRDRAHALGDELAQRFDADVEVEEGKLGQFDVLVDGKRVASRGESWAARMLPRDAPNASQVMAAIEAHCKPREGEACPVPEK